jgi:hypothetical protein
MTTLLGGPKPKIAFISQPEYFRFIYERALDDLAEVWEFKLHMGLKPEDFAELIAYQADFNFFFRGEFVPEGVLEQLQGLKIALSSEPFPRVIDGHYEYTLDSINRYLDFRSIRTQPYDYVFHYDGASLPLLNRDGLSLSGEFAFPVDTTVYKHQQKPAVWDLFFIGRSTAHREAHFGYLKHHYQFLHICHGIFGPSLVDYMTAAKICLNIHAEHEVSWEPRMQMMLACGVFVISEKITPNKYLRPGVDYMEVGSPHELHQAVAHYLTHDSERLAIAQNGYNRVRETLNSQICFKQMTLDLSRNKYPKFSVGKQAHLCEAAAIARSAWRRMNSSFACLTK